MAAQQLLQHLKQEKGMSHVQKDSSLLSYFSQTIIRISDLKTNWTQLAYQQINSFSSNHLNICNITNLVFLTMQKITSYKSLILKASDSY